MIPNIEAGGSCSGGSLEVVAQVSKWYPGVWFICKMANAGVVTLEKRIKISTKATGAIEAALTDENPQTAQRIWNALPIEGRANRWGNEIYFSIPISFEEEHAKAEVDLGAVAYWPPGSALCIFFGKTPASKDDKPRAASPVNVFAKINTDSTIFRKVRDGEKVTIEKGSA
jgi:hypothetical protein